jgi:CheY-like chemotaxis protein
LRYYSYPTREGGYQGIAGWEFVWGALRGFKDIMEEQTALKDKIVLIVDDEPDVLEAVAEQLDMCLIHKATDHETAYQYLMDYTYDIVILDIMGVDGFELLKLSVRRGFPTVMLTAHAMTPETLKKSIKLGALSFMPKEKIAEIKDYLEDVVLGGGKAVWEKLFDKLGSYFNKRFGPGWEKKDRFLKEFIETLKESETKGSSK